MAMLSPASAGDDPLAEMERAGRVTRAVNGWEQPPPRREADASTTETIQSMRDRDAAR
ncbi:hypothetical protein [Salsipaludibacter albus]|uniref:hypothetical protein n=1 Tax=Salsipaludibacter albus TaxID=2849650 RepID=UPI001EE49244|nr:hypothetical protein [Salsipaludibacter albus]MBY5162067.1 hypothetical protein [Salsipaludibacter albus]